MKHVFLKSVQVKEQIKPRKSKVKPSKSKVKASTDEQKQVDISPDEVFEDDYYNNKPEDSFEDIYYEYVPENNEKAKSSIIYNIETFRNYTISGDCIIKYKDAKDDKEHKKPFIVAKVGNTRNVIDGRDIIFKSLKKMTVEDREVQRIGYLLADKKPKNFIIKETNADKYRGTANNNLLINRNRPSGYRKIGYLKLKEYTRTKDLYVEVLARRSNRWLGYLTALIIAIGLFSQIDLSNLPIDNTYLAKLIELIDEHRYIENDLDVTYNIAPVCKYGSVNIGIYSDYTDDGSFIIELVDKDGTLLYRSEKINTGESLPEIQLTQVPARGQQECILKCHSYKHNRYTGSVEHKITISVE